MSALLQFTNRLEQPRVPPAYEPAPMATWLREQLNEQPKPRRPVCPPQDIYRQSFNREVPSDSVLKGLEDAYVIDDRSTVTAFIEQNRLRGLLLQARDPLIATFGEAAVKTLMLIDDDEGFNTLFCLIAVSGDMHEARLALRSFDERWWLTRSDQAAGKLNFDVELV